MLAIAAVAGTTGLALWFAVFRPKPWSSAAAAEAATLIVADCGVLASPAWAPRLHLIAQLDLRDCGLRELPAAIGACTGLTKLDLGGNPLADLPDELERCVALEVVFLLGSPELKHVPRVLGRLPRLTRIGLKSNAIAEIAPDALPPTVEHLILTDNRLTALPPALFARLANVRKLMLANNALASLPAEVAHMRSLELVRLSNNRLSSLPAELLALPKLAWLALSGNPLSPPPPPPVAPTAAEAEIVVDESAGGKLGEGASGAVRAGTFRGAPVAIKGFKAVSSDGRAEDEVALYAALAHPSIVACVGVLREPRLALLLERLPPTTRDLAGPPTIVEVIEDRYGDAWSGSTFSARFASRVARAVGRALAHLHSQRVAHGDVYGHNTLVLDADAAGVRLGDFGAAYSYRGLAASSVERGGAFGDEVFELIEVRAYGTLLGELATHSAADAVRAPRTHAWLRDASRRCLVPDVLQRPRFATLAAEMAELFEDGAALKK